VCHEENGTMVFLVMNFSTSPTKKIFLWEMHDSLTKTSPKKNEGNFDLKITLQLFGENFE
jgi:hypothetical protein